MPVNLKKTKHIHFVGVKGVGMTALALCAQDMGIKVTGSDIPELFITDKVLSERGINWSEGFSSENIEKSVDLVITTGAHGGLANIEVLTAKERGIKAITHAEALAEFTKGKETVAVCGVGGKTTTSSMISYILEKAKKEPSYAVGVSEIFGLGYGGKYNKKGKHFVCEADEYVVSPGLDERPKFHLLSPKIIVVTNVVHDHPDVYPTFEDTKKAYLEFFEKLPKDGVLVYSQEDKLIGDLAKKTGKKTFTYGFSKSADVRILRKSVGIQEKELELIDKKGSTAKLTLKVPGEYNIRNAVSAVLAATLTGVSLKEACLSLASFTGAKRRFEVVGKTPRGNTVVDDYAHHPDEIRQLINAAREAFPGKKIVVVFQPHTYSRTKALFNDFVKSLSLADKVGLIDIYSSLREEKDPEVTSESLALEVKKLNKNTFYLGSLSQATSWLKENIQENEVLLTVGAGDIFYMHKELLSK